MVSVFLCAVVNLRDSEARKAKHFHPICNCRPLPDDLTKIGKFSVQCGVLR